MNPYGKIHEADIGFVQDLRFYNNVRRTERFPVVGPKERLLLIRKKFYTWDCQIKFTEYLGDSSFKTYVNAYIVLKDENDNEFIIDRFKSSNPRKNFAVAFDRFGREVIVWEEHNTQESFIHYFDYGISDWVTKSLGLNTRSPAVSLNRGTFFGTDILDNSEFVPKYGEDRDTVVTYLKDDGVYVKYYRENKFDTEFKIQHIKIDESFELNGAGITKDWRFGWAFDNEVSKEKIV